MPNSYRMKLLIASYLNLPAFLPKSIHPWKVNLSLTENCNSKCITCDYWKTHHKQYITTDRAKYLIEELHSLGIKNIRLTGGEPLLRKDLFEVLGICNPDWFDKIILDTNGLLLSRFQDKINTSVITDVNVSLDGIGETNDRIRGVKGYYNKVIKSLQPIHKKKHIVSNFTKFLIPDLEKLITYAEEQGYGYSVNLLDKQLRFFSSKEVQDTVESLWPSEEDIEKGLQILSEHKILPDYILEEAHCFLTQRRFKFNHCMLGYFVVNIDSIGAVRTGCNVFEPVGNILEQNLKDIINSATYNDSARTMYQLKCPLCTCGYESSVHYKHPWKAALYALKQIMG